MVRRSLSKKDRARFLLNLFDVQGEDIIQQIREDIAKAIERPLSDYLNASLIPLIEKKFTPESNFTQFTQII